MNMISKIEQPQIDARELRNILGDFATGVAVVTTIGNNELPVGMTINSFSSVSLDPPLILWSIGLKTPSYGAFSEHTGFAINIMCAESKELSLNFARPAENKFKDIKWHAGESGVPVLDEALSTLECVTQDRISAGDHDIFIGRVVRMNNREGDALGFHRGKFVSLGSEV